MLCSNLAGRYFMGYKYLKLKFTHSWKKKLNFNNFISFYPTVLKGCRGIVFTHGVRMGGRREIVCPGCISETIKCRKFIQGHWLGGVGVQRHGLTLI